MHRTAITLLACEQCGSAGWLPPKARDAFPDACATCNGGYVSLGELARKLDPKHRDFDRRIEVSLRKIHNGAPIRARTGLRVLELLESRGMLPRAPRKQLEIGGTS